jgi:hypothetical protein
MSASAGMLPLDSPRWSTMRQCGGYSTVIPALLRKLENPAHFMEERQAFDSLHHALAPCGDVDAASYAAVPHLARIGMARKLPASEWISLIADVEAGRVPGRAETVPEDLAEAYFETIAALPRLIADHAPKTCSLTEAAALAGALAVVLGHPRLGRAIEELGEELVTNNEEQ